MCDKMDKYWKRKTKYDSIEDVLYHASYSKHICILPPEEIEKV